MRLFEMVTGGGRRLLSAGLYEGRLFVWAGRRDRPLFSLSLVARPVVRPLHQCAECRW